MVDEILRITYTPPASTGADPIIFASTDSPGLTLLNGVRGLGIAPVAHTTSARAFGHGSTHIQTRLEEREIYLPVLIDGDTIAEVEALKDSYVDAMNPLAGPGTLTVTRLSDGRQRSIPVRYKDGLQGEYGSDFYGTFESFGFTFLATEAFWAGEETTLKWDLKYVEKPFLSATVPFFPIVLSRSHVNGSYEVTIGGEAPAELTWTIKGPATDITVKNETTGQKFTLTGDVRAGETVTINTAENTLAGSAKTEDELWDALTLDSVLFTLSPGTSKILVTATGLTEDSSIQASYHQRYLKGY